MHQNLSRFLKLALAFLWLTVGYWFFSTIVPFVLMLLPYVGSGGGISMSSEQGVHQLRFSGRPGDLVLVLYVSDAGEKNLTYTTSSKAVRSSSTTYEWSNAIVQLSLVALFAVVTIPLLRRLLRNAEPNAAPKGGPATRLGSSAVAKRPPSVS